MLGDVCAVCEVLGVRELRGMELSPCSVGGERWRRVRDDSCLSEGSRREAMIEVCKS